MLSNATGATDWRSAPPDGLFFVFAHDDVGRPPSFHYDGRGRVDIVLWATITLHDIYHRHVSYL